MPFLADHVVGGRALLSTVMGIEIMATAAAAATGVGGQGMPEAQSLRALAVADVRVLPPYLLDEGQTGGVCVDVARRSDPETVGTSEPTGTTLDCELVSTGAVTTPDATSTVVGQVHFRANVTVGHDFANSAQPRFPPEYESGDPQVDSGLIYGLFFHGPSFRVLHSAYFSSRVMVGILNDHLPPLAEPAGPTAMAPLLIELAMQTAGLWEIGASGRMMIPESLERIRRFSSLEAYDSTAVYALVTPRSRRPLSGKSRSGKPLSGTRPDSVSAADGVSAADSVFDVDVVDESGRLHLRVEGYRTTPFGHPPDAKALSGVASALAGIT